MFLKAPGQFLVRSLPDFMHSHIASRGSAHHKPASNLADTSELFHYNSCVGRYMLWWVSTGLLLYYNRYLTTPKGNGLPAWYEPISWNWLPEISEISGAHFLPEISEISGAHFLKWIGWNQWNLRKLFSECEAGACFCQYQVINSRGKARSSSSSVENYGQ